ncbi:MAG: SgcQ protein, partial [Bacteroidetes bacterium]
TYLTAADGLIVGSALKVDGHWANALDAGRVKAIVNLVHTLR